MKTSSPQSVDGNAKECTAGDSIKKDVKESVALLETPKYSKITPVLTEPAQEGLGRIGRTKESNMEGYQETSGKGEYSLFKEERTVSLAEVVSVKKVTNLLEFVVEVANQKRRNLNLLKARTVFSLLITLS